MLKKVFICPWFGPEPSWMSHYWERARDKGFDWLLEDDVEAFRQRVGEKLGIDAPIKSGGSKVHDYRACLGYLYEEEIAGYDFWGHTDFDCAYGRLGHFYPDGYLSSLDIHSDHWAYVSGPLSLYRNSEQVNSLFLRSPEWRDILTQPETTGWVEQGFTTVVLQSPLRTSFRTCHGWRDVSLLRQEDDRLYEGEREISFFHFRYTKKWPL